MILKTRFTSLAITCCVLYANIASGQSPPPIQEPYIWKNVEIVGGGFVPGIIFNPTQPNLVYARTDIGGAYRLDSQTQRWIPLNDWAGADDWNMFGVESIGTDPVEPNRVYMACGTYTRDFATTASIFRSTDQGNAWKRAKLPFKMGGNENGRSIGERLAIDPHDNRILYFGSRNDGLWKSENFGETWSKVESFPITGKTNGIGIGFVLFDSLKTIYVGVATDGTHLYRSTDAGATWSEVPGQTKGFLPHHGVLTPEGLLYLTYGNGPGPNGVTDGAVRKFDTHRDQWTDITPVKPSANQKFGYAGLSVDAKHPDTLLVSTIDRWSAGDDLFRSTDAGQTWKPLKPKATRDSSVAPFLDWGKTSADLGHWVGDVEIDPHNSDHALYVTGATIWGADDLTKLDRDEMTHWTARAAGLEETAILDLISPPAGPHLISGIGDLGGFAHDDLAVSPKQGMFQNPTFSTGRSVDFAELKPDIVVRAGHGAQNKNGAISTDGGSTWRPFETNPPGGKPAGRIVVSADGSAIVWSPDGTSPYASFDEGKTWTASTGLGGEARLAADRVNPAKIYAFESNKGFFSSDDSGKTFKRSDFEAPKGGKIRAVPGHEGDVWIAGEEAGGFRSNDSGATFKHLDNVERMDAVGFGKAASGKDYPAVYMTGKVGGIAGVFRSDDAGTSWVRINDDMHQYGWIGQVVIGDPRVYGRVYLGTNGRGILVADPAKER